MNLEMGFGEPYIYFKRTNGLREVVTPMEGKDRYNFESFSADDKSFDMMFSDFINRKYGDGWKYKDCHYHMEGNMRRAYCLFKKMM